MSWLTKNMQAWTPFSVIVLLMTVGTVFVVVWDTTRNIALPNYVLVLISLLLGGTGATQLVSHGSGLANGTAASTAATAAAAAAQAAVSRVNEINASRGLPSATTTTDKTD